ncbi:MAG TPA: TraB/GumN family protein [Gammaproteobacteria bacterium]|nr:TraB/GumN family protein [Gammaproteobacteria bacterium]
MRAHRFLIATLLLAGIVRAEPTAWRVGGDAAGEVWLLGSVHYLRERDHPLPAIVDELYARADALVMEVDLDDLDPASVSALSLRAAMLSAPATLGSVLGRDLYARTATTALGFGLELAHFEPFEPWLVAMTLMDLGMAERGYRADQGLEQHLLRRAVVDGKAVHGLEAITDQIGVLDGMTMAEQEALLAQTLAEIETPEQDMDQLVAAWREGNLAELADELSASFADFPRLYQTLVVDRNTRWVPEIERLARGTQRYLVVVGALHLVGERNVVELLRSRGLRVEAVN